MLVSRPMLISVERSLWELPRGDLWPKKFSWVIHKIKLWRQFCCLRRQFLAYVISSSTVRFKHLEMLRFSKSLELKAKTFLQIEFKRLSSTDGVQYSLAHSYFAASRSRSLKLFMTTSGRVSKTSRARAKNKTWNRAASSMNQVNKPASAILCFALFLLENAKCRACNAHARMWALKLNLECS